MYVLIGGYGDLFVVHPLGLRDTFLWFLIAPFLIAAPLGVLTTGIRAWRRPLGEPRQPAEPDAEHSDARHI